MAALNNKGNMYSDLGRDEKAPEVYEKALSIDPHNSNHRKQVYTLTGMLRLGKVLS